MVADIDSAHDHVHACFYIWLDDTNGLKLKDAMVRAAKRGVTVRVFSDALGSRNFVRSPHWRELQEAGVEARVALPVGNLLWTMIRGRVDLRNHRKLLVIDDAIAWCGSQNAADPEFRVKPHYAPWVDVMSRWEGPRHARLAISVRFGLDGRTWRRSQRDASCLLHRQQPAASSRRSSEPGRPCPMRR